MSIIAIFNMLWLRLEANFADMPDPIPLFNQEPLGSLYGKTICDSKNCNVRQEF